MGKFRGYILPLTESRFDVLEERLGDDYTFGEPVPSFTRADGQPLLCFVVSGSELTHIASASRGSRAGTRLHRLNLDKAETLSTPISLQRLDRKLPSSMRASIRRRVLEGGVLTPKGFAALVTAVRDLLPSRSEILERYSVERIRDLSRISATAKRGLAFQKEAVLTALDLADFDRNSLRDWAPSPQPISFLDGLPNARLREDPMVLHDLHHLPGFELVEQRSYGAAVFKSGTEHLTVILANRLPLEEQTGTDLIYYNETYQSFVMVQYKAMEQEASEGRTQAVFRLPNKQLAVEVARMERLRVQLQACPASSNKGSFRLSENPFFLKLCPRLVFDPDNVDLIRGMYLPLDYWLTLESDSCIKGSRGGKRVTFDNAGRYLDNTTFARIVAKAWVGTTAAQSSVLREVIRQTLASGKAVTIAIKPAPTRDDDPDEAPANLVTNDVQRAENIEIPNLEETQTSSRRLVTVSE
jgi:hypothetical protein